MAGNTDVVFHSDLLDVQNKIKEFPDKEIDHALNNTVSALSRSISKKRTFTQVQEKELSQLEKEVNFLEKQVAEKEDILKAKTGTTPTNENKDKKEKLQSLDEIHDEIAKIEEKIEMMQKLTGYEFMSNSCEILNEDLRNIQKQYRIQGLCGEIKFNIEFEVEEKMLKMDGEEEPLAEITSLTIYVPDEVFKELHTGLDSIVSRKSLQGFFRMLEPYSQWYEYRQKTFEHFHHMYPDCTNVIEDNHVPCLIVQNPKHQNGPVFAIQWTFTVDQIYRTQPCLNLGVQAPEELCKHDGDKVLKSAPENFQLMLKELGIERTIETIIQLMQKL